MTRDAVRGMVEGSLRRLEEWVDRHGWDGWDPFDIRGQRAFRKLQSVPLVNLKLRVLAFAFPYWTRRVFGVEKRAYPEAMAAFSRGYLALYELSGDEKHRDNAISCLDWLEENRCQGYAYFCWGAAFDWDYEALLVPKGTPDSTATSMAARAFFDAYKLLGEERFVRIAGSACNFLIEGLNVDHPDGDKVCFSYTPLDSTHVHNANLFNAAILATVGAELGNPGFLKFGRKALNYALAEQNADGSWYYRGTPDFGGRHIDSYHTGFMLRNLCYLYHVFGEGRIKESLLKGYRYYVHELLLGPIPKIAPERLYPVDIYSCAEAIFCLATLAGVLPEAVEKACGVAEWTIRNMQDRRGYFYYRRYRLFTQKSAFVRWGQAIMFEALFSLLRILRSS